MTYLDSSALFKLFRQEAESDALEAWLIAQGAVPHVSSALALVEVLRGARCVDTATERDARRLLAKLDLIPITASVLDSAASLADPLLRSLDAIHLASALSIRSDLVALITYDNRMATAATRAGLPLVVPRAN